MLYLDYINRWFFVLNVSECRSKREMPSMYLHCKDILNALKDKGVKMAIASRSPTRDIAETFLDKLGIKSMFVAQVCENLTLWKYVWINYSKREDFYWMIIYKPLIMNSGYQYFICSLLRVKMMIVDLNTFMSI